MLFKMINPDAHVPTDAELATNTKISSDSSVAPSSTNTTKPIPPKTTICVNPVLPIIVYQSSVSLPFPPLKAELESVVIKNTTLVAGSSEFERIAEKNLILIKSANRRLIKKMTEVNENIEKNHHPDYLGIPGHLAGRKRRRYDPAIAIFKFRNAVRWRKFDVGGNYSNIEKVVRALGILTESRNKCGHIDKLQLLSDSDKFLTSIQFLSGPTVLNVPSIMNRATRQLVIGKMTPYRI